MGSYLNRNRPRLFRSLIADEQRKNRRDQRRRTEIEKQIRDHQKSRPSGIREAPSQPDLREAARSGRDAKSARGARGMFLRTIRPLSIAIRSNPFGEKPEPQSGQSRRIAENDEYSSWNEGITEITARWCINIDSNYI